MEFRTDLVFSVPQYSNTSKGLLTLGEFKTVQLDNGQSIELLPYLIETHYTRGVSRNDPRVRRCYRNAITLLAESYADHYNSAGIDEHWTREEVEEMMNWQYGQSLGRFFFVKWGREVETQKEFPVGFVSAYSKPFQGGNMLWDGEIFVLPEYQKYGIGTELHTVLLGAAKASGIKFFEALTYEDENGYPFKLWDKYGVSRSDLIHIYGEVEEMLTKVESINEEKHKTL